METNPVVNDPKTAPQPKKTWKSYIGWAGFVVTLGILLQQVYMHWESIITYYIPVLLNGKFVHYLTSADPLYTSLFKFVYVLELANVLFFAVFSILALVMLIIRKKKVPSMLVTYMAVAGIYNLIHLILVNLLPNDLGMTTFQYNIESGVYIVIDVLLILFYTKSVSFRKLFDR